MRIPGHGGGIVHTSLLGLQPTSLPYTMVHTARYRSDEARPLLLEKAIKAIKTQSVSFGCTLYLRCVQETDKGGATAQPPVPPSPTYDDHRPQGTRTAAPDVSQDLRENSGPFGQ